MDCCGEHKAHPSCVVEAGGLSKSSCSIRRVISILYSFIMVQIRNSVVSPRQHQKADQSGLAAPTLLSQDRLQVGPHRGWCCRKQDVGLPGCLCQLLPERSLWTM